MFNAKVSGILTKDSAKEMHDSNKISSLYDQKKYYKNDYGDLRGKKAPILTSCIFFVFSSVMFNFRGAMIAVGDRDVSFEVWEGGGVFGISNLDHF